MEDGRLVPGRPGGRFIGRVPERSGLGEPQEVAKGHPVIGAGGSGRGRRHGPWDALGTPGTRAGRPGTGLTRRVLARFARECRGRAAGDQVIQPVMVESPVGLRGDQMVASRLGRSGRGKAVGQEQHQCPPPTAPVVRTESTSWHPCGHSHRMRDFPSKATNLGTRPA